jgi:glycerol kinase
MLAGVGVGLFANPQAAAGMSKVERAFRVEMSPDERARHHARWADAVARTRSNR